MPAAISYVMRMAIMGFIVAGVWYVTNTYTENIKGIEQLNQMKYATELVQTGTMHVLESVQKNASIKQLLTLPKLDKDYIVNLSCKDGDLLINATAPILGKSFIIKNYINCSNMQVSGQVGPGQRCIIGEKTNIIILRLESDC